MADDKVQRMRQAQAKRFGAPPPARRPAKRPKFRLPDGAVFHSVYHAKEETWDVTLTLPDGRRWVGKGQSLLGTQNRLGRDCHRAVNRPA